MNIVYNIIILLLSCIQLLTFEVYVYSDIANVFQHCNIPGQKNNTSDSNSSDNSVISAQIGLKNERYCKETCSRVLSDNDQNSILLNSGLILECTSLCREQIIQGTNSKYIYLASKQKAIAMTKTNNKSACIPDPKNPKNKISQSASQNLKFNIFPYSAPIALPFNTVELNQKATDKYFNVDLNSDTLILKLDSSQKNIIYGCGHRIINLNPVFPNMFAIAPQALVGGNAAQNALAIDMTKDSIEALISNSHYGGLYNFDYDGYIKSFNYINDIPSDFTVLKKRLFCDICKQDAVLNTQHDCMSFAKKQSFDDKASKEFCDSCSCNYSVIEKYQIQVRVGKMTKSDCESALKQNNISYNSKTCDIIPYTLINAQNLLAYQNLSDVTVNNDTKFYKSSWANDNKNSDWASDTMKYHACFSDQQTPLSNQELLNMTSSRDPTNTTVSLKNYPDRVGCFPEWHNYNTDFLDTTLRISDGDFLTISWGGDMIVGNGLDIPFINQGIAKMLAANDNAIFNSYKLSNNTTQIKSIELLKMMSTLDFENLSSIIGENGQKPQKSSSNSSAQDGVICNGSTIYDLNYSSSDQNYQWYGLNGKVHRSVGGIISDTSCPPKSQPNNDKTCKDTNLFSDRYEFSGNIQNIGQNVPLKMRHHMPANDTEKFLYKNSIITGGQQVQIEWGGCPMKDGNGLEIALGDENSTDQNLTWQAVTSTSINNGYRVGPNNGSADLQYNTEKKLFLRVNTPNSGLTSDGAYHIRVTRDITQHNSNIGGKMPQWLSDLFFNNEDLNIMKQIAKTLFSVLIGNTDNIDNGERFDGVIVMLSLAIAKNFHSVIIVVLILYISILGLNFMMGTIKMNQQELIKILMKISLAIMILVPDTWAWFIENYIRLFIVGNLKLAYSIQMTVYSILNGEEIIDRDMFNIFSTWKLFFYIIQETFSKKLLALMFSSLAGLIIAIIIVIGVVKSFMVIIKAMLFYMSMMLMQCIALLFVPFVFLGRLFKITSNIFDQWFKHVILFLILPSAVVITVTMFLLMLIIGIDATMNFTYCDGCINLFGMCIIPTFYTLGMGFLPDNGGSHFLLPMGLVSGALAFLAISEAGQKAIEIAYGIISRMITFRAETLNQSGFGMTVENAGKSALVGAMEFKQQLTHNIKDEASKVRRDEKSLNDIGKRLDKIDK